MEKKEMKIRMTTRHLVANKRRILIDKTQYQADIF